MLQQEPFHATARVEYQRFLKGALPGRLHGGAAHGMPASTDKVQRYIANLSGWAIE